MSRRPDPTFRPEELSGGDGPTPTAAELREAGAMAIDLERVARASTARPTPGFASRVMAAVASEPSPAPSHAAAESIRRHSAVGLLGALRDAVRVTFGPARPAVMRGQAFALLLVVVIGLGSLGGATAFAASQWIAPLTAPAVEATASPSPSASAISSAEPSAEPSESAEPSSSGETESGSPGDGATGKPGETPTASAGSSGHPEETGSPKASQSPHPSPTVTETPH